MTTNQDRPHRAATFVDADSVWLRLYRTTSTPAVCLTVTDYETGTDHEEPVSVSFSLNRRHLDLLIAALQHESELLAAPAVGERRRAPADHPHLAGCEVIRVEDAARATPSPRRWFAYRGSTSGIWTSGHRTTDAEVANWLVIE